MMHSGSETVPQGKKKALERNERDFFDANKPLRSLLREMSEKRFNTEL